MRLATQRGHAGGTLRQHVRAAGAEHAAGRRRGRAGRLALQQDPGPPRARVQMRRGRQQGARVGMARMRGTAASTGPSSITRPRYITTTRSQRWRTTGRSWLMNSIARPSRVRRSASSASTCACTETSSADTGSSATRKSGPRRQRAGDADALPLAAGELVRVSLRMFRRQADLAPAMPPPGPVGPAGARMSWIASPSAICAPTRRRGSRLPYGSWNTSCMRRRSRRIKPARWRRGRCRRTDAPPALAAAGPAAAARPCSCRSRSRRPAPPPRRARSTGKHPSPPAPAARRKASRRTAKSAGEVFGPHQRAHACPTGCSARGAAGHCLRPNRRWPRVALGDVRTAQRGAKTQPGGTRMRLRHHAGNTGRRRPVLDRRASQQRAV